MRYIREKVITILMLLVAMLVILLALCLAGCGLATSTQGQEVQVIYSEGGCLMIVEGLSVEQVAEKEKEWTFDEGCRINVKTIID